MPSLLSKYTGQGKSLLSQYTQPQSQYDPNKNFYGDLQVGQDPSVIEQMRSGLDSFAGGVADAATLGLLPQSSPTSRFGRAAGQEPIANIAGQFAGMALPYGGAEAALSQVPGLVGQNLLPRILRGAVAGTGVQTAQQVISGQGSPEDLLVGAGMGAAADAVLPPMFEAIAKIPSLLRGRNPRIPEIITKAMDVQPEVPVTQSPEPVVAPVIKQKKNYLRSEPITMEQANALDQEPSTRLSRRQNKRMQEAVDMMGVKGVDKGDILTAKFEGDKDAAMYLGSTGDPNAISQFVTGTSPLNKAWEGFVDKAKSRIGKVIPEKVKQTLAYDSGRPEAWEAAKLARQQNIAGGIEETLGLAKAGKEQFTPDTHGKAYDYLDPTERMTAKPTDLTPEQSASLDRMRETQTKLTNEQVELGLLDKDVAEANASTYLRRFYDKHEKMDGFLASTFRKYRLKGTGKRYLETPEERMAAGIKRDPFYAFAKSTAAQRHDIETGKLFAKVAESPEFKDLVGDKPKAGFAPKPIPNTWQYGKLRNKYVAQSVYDDIMEIARPWETSEMSQIYGKLLGVWKAGKTAWNPATHGRNIFSSAIQNDVIAGLSPSRVDKYVNAIQGMLKNEPELRQFKDLGGYEGTFNAAELQDFLGKVKTKRGSMMNRGLDYVLEHKLTSPLRAMSKAYQTEEIAFRYAAYKHRLSLGDAPEMAMKIAKQAIPDYAQVPDFIRKVRRSPIGLPFVSYAYKMLPAIAESAIKHPLRAGKYIALTYAMNEFAKSQMGISDEQYNQLRKSKNFNGGSQILLPFTDKAGDPVVMDLTYNLPWGDMLEWGAAAGGTFGQSEGGTGLMDKGLSMLNPIAKSAIEIGGNRNTYTGRDLTTQSMSNWDKSKAIGGQLLNTFAPTFPSRGIPNIIKAAVGEKDYYGKKRDLPTTLAKNLAGISVSPINQQAEMQGRTMEFKKTLEDYQRRIYNAARKNDKGEVDRLVKEYSDYAKKFSN